MTLIDVPSVMMKDVLANLRVTRVDLLSVDTENSELQVLRGFDFVSVFVDVIVVEDAYPALSGSLFEFLKSEGFEFIAKVELDLVFRNRQSLAT